MTRRSIAEHRAVVAAALQRMPVLDVALADAAGAMLAADVVAQRDVPAAPTAALDGYVLRSEDVAGAHGRAPVTLPVTHDIGLDPRVPRRLAPRTAMRILSGAPVPAGADAVLAWSATPWSETEGGAAFVTVTAPVSAGESIRPQGYDAVAGATLLHAGMRLGPRHLAIAAAMGVERLHVHPVPRVVVVPVGDELRDRGGQTSAAARDVTGPLVTDLVREAGAHAYRVPAVSDDRRALRAALEDQLVRADVIVTTGSLSSGWGDTVAQVLGQLGEVERVELALAPGGFHAVGAVVTGSRTVPVLCLPGHPVSALVAFEAYVRDALRAMSGRDDAERGFASVEIAVDMASVAGVAQAIPVWLEVGGSVGLRATPVGEGATASLAQCAAAHGLVMVPDEVAQVRRGAVLRCRIWDA